MSKTQAEVIAEIVQQFEQSIEEIETATHLKRYVVTMDDCRETGGGTPFRFNPDGGEIRLYGGAIYTTAFSSDADHIASGLSKQLKAKGSESSAIYVRAAEWKPKRIAAIRALIELVKKQQS